MDIARLAAVAVLSVVAIVLVRQVKPELAVVLTVAVCVLCVFTVLDQLFSVVYAFYDLSEKAGVDEASLSAVLKIVGIGYLGEFCNNICLDAGCKSVGDKVLFAAKLSIILVALPIVNNLLSLLMQLIL